MNKKGFTLVEMLVVIAIIAVLVAIIVPTALAATTKAAAATNAANLRNYASEVAIALLSNNATLNDDGTVTGLTAPQSKACGSFIDAGISAKVQKNANDEIETYFEKGTDKLGVDYFGNIADTGSEDTSKKLS